MNCGFYVDEDDNADHAGGSGAAAEPFGAEEEAV